MLIEASQFPIGPAGACHPLNLEGPGGHGFFLDDPACHELYLAREQLLPDWRNGVNGLAEIAAFARNCSSVQQCGLLDLMVTTWSYFVPGHRPQPEDPYRRTFWQVLGRRQRRAQRRHLQGLYKKHREDFANADQLGRPLPRPEEVTLGIHADPKSAEGKWRGQLEAFKAYAKAHGLRWFLDKASYFTGEVLFRYLGLYWATSSSAVKRFPRNIEYLHPRSRLVQEGLVVFTQPPQYWDSLEAFAETLPTNAWTIWMDYDFTISPCCFHEFSLHQLIQHDEDGYLPHIIVRDSPHEDYLHHCANAGFFIVRNSAIGRLFLSMAQSKRGWPAIPYGYQSAMAESLLELLGLEKDFRAGHTQGGHSYRSQCVQHMANQGATSSQSYATFCHCHRQMLNILAGKPTSRRSRWVRFVSPGLRADGVEPGLLVPSLFIHHSDRARGAGYLPLTTWSRDKHRSYMDAWLPHDNEAFGGACATMPLMIHWASVPHRPRLLYDFLHGRFPNQLSLSVLMNGTSEDIDAAYRAAGAEGQRRWDAFRVSAKGAEMLRLWAHNETLWPLSSACSLTSERLWKSGGVHTSRF